MAVRGVHELSLREARVRAAAARHGARLEVWTAVHRLHLDRARVEVRPTVGHVALGYIVEIDDRGFGLDGGVRWLWPDVTSVERVDG